MQPIILQPSCYSHFTGHAFWYLRASGQVFCLDPLHSYEPIMLAGMLVVLFYWPHRYPLREDAIQDVLLNHFAYSVIRDGHSIGTTKRHESNLATYVQLRSIRRQSIASDPLNFKLNFGTQRSRGRIAAPGLPGSVCLARDPLRLESEPYRAARIPYTYGYVDQLHAATIIARPPCHAGFAGFDE